MRQTRHVHSDLPLYSRPILHNFWQISYGPSDARDCVIAMDDMGTVIVAWRQDGNIHSFAINGDMISGDVNHGPGENPALCWTPTGFVLAWSYLNSIRLSSSLDFEWSATETVAGHGLSIGSISLTGCQPGIPFSEAYLCWEEQDQSIWFSHGGPGGWATSQLVRYHESTDLVLPRALPAETVGGVWPRIYHLTWAALLYVDGVAYSWSAPSAVPSEIGFGMDYDVAVGPGYSQHVMGLGLLPPCPCNAIFYTECPPGGDWIETEWLTVNIGDYDWPHDPSLGVDANGRAHGFWYQEEYNLMLEPVGESMHYFVRDGGRLER